MLASEQAEKQDLRKGAPPARPNGGHYMTTGGVQVTANVEAVQFSRSLQGDTSARRVEDLVGQLDSKRGVLLTSSYEFPGRYARWSLGFVDPPLELSGKGSKCTIRALNSRGRVLMPAIQRAMDKLQEEGTLQSIEASLGTNTGSGDGLETVPVQLDVTVVPPSAVGTFTEEERSRQVSAPSSIMVRGYDR